MIDLRDCAKIRKSKWKTTEKWPAKFLISSVPVYDKSEIASRIFHCDIVETKILVITVQYIILPVSKL
jgi:hypothetical protein